MISAQPSTWHSCRSACIGIPTASVVLRKAVDLDPKSAEATADLANFYRLQNRSPEAIQVLQDAVSKNPTSSALYVQLASILDAEGKGSEASAILENLRNTTHNSAETAIAIGDYYFQGKQPEKALREYQQGLAVSPTTIWRFKSGFRKSTFRRTKCRPPLTLIRS